MMRRYLSITSILLIAIVWTGTLAKSNGRCPPHCKCDYRGSSYCSFGNCNMTLKLEDLGTAHSMLHINCSAEFGASIWELNGDIIIVPYGEAAGENCIKGTDFSCFDFPELRTIEVYKYVSYGCSPRILRCLKRILGEVQINNVILHKPSEVLLREDVVDLKNVTASWLVDLKDDMIINSDAIFGWPSLSKVYVIGGTLQLSPNNNITNNALKHISLKAVNICSFPEGGFRRLTRLKSFEMDNFDDLLTNERQDVCGVGSVDIHAGAFKGLAKLQILTLINVKSIEPGTFADTPNLVKVGIFNSPLEFVPNGLFEGMTSLIEIELTCNGPEITLDTHAFSQNVALKVVKIQFCQVNSLADQLFINSNNITNFEIKYGSVRNVSPKTFSHLLAMEHISLKSNELVELTGELFSNLTSLHTLELVDSGIKKLYDNAFSNLYSLSKLLLHFNNIQELPETIFKNLTSLQTLWLHSNMIQKLPESIFSNLNKLTELELQKNYISELPEDIFGSLVSLTWLSLAKNNLSKLHENNFLNVTSLLNLDLSNNNLEVLPNKIFISLTSLEQLKLHNNKIWELPDFSNLTSLIQLDLSNNFIAILSPTSFYKLSNLKELILKNNTISKFEAYDPDSPYTLSFLSNTPILPFETLENLVTLDLSGNNLRQLYKYWQNDLKNVRELDLSYNHFRNIKDFQVDYSDMRIIIDLQYNEITEVIFDPRVSYSNETPNAWNTSMVILSNNPIVCDCNSYGLLRRVQGDKLPDEPLYDNRYSYGEPIICAAPPNLKESFLMDVKPDQLVCDLSKHLPDNCSSYTAIAVTNEVILSCPQMPSTWIDIEANDFPYVFFEQPTVTLNLENQPESIEHLNIHTLNLSNAKIHEIAFAPTDSLTVLDLSHNNLVSIPDQFLNTNITLYLSGNPLFCDCLLVRKFNNMTTLADAASIMCINEGKLKDINEDELCHRLQSLTSVIAISAVCGVLVIMVTVPLCKYIKRNWTNISKIFFCSRRHSSESIELSRTEVHKQFDLYITFTYQDEEFVRENLLPKLQFEFNQKCCVHYRDGTDEDLVPEQIIEAVDNSAKTVIILTDSYLKSQLAYVAFSRAHDLNKQDSISKIIIILLKDDITQNEEIRDDLKPYLTSNSTLLWGHPNFWILFKDNLPRKN